MATEQCSLAQPDPPVTSSPDCPQCGSLCLGPVAFPCGHVICRRCLRDLLEERHLRLSCQSCGHPLRLPWKMTIGQLVQKMGTEPIMENAVRQQLDNISHVPCLNCPNLQAHRVCLDCQEYYCNNCSAIHCRSRAARDHVLHPLSQALQNAPSPTACASTATTPDPGLSSAMSTTSSIRNPALLLHRARDTTSTGDESEWKEWVEKRMGQLREASGGKLKARTLLQDLASLIQELMTGVHADEQDLDAYQHHLPRLTAVQRTDTDNYVIQAPGSDVTMTVRTESLEKRLALVMQGRYCLDLDALKAMWTQFDQMLHPADPDLDVTSSSAEGSITSSTSSLNTAQEDPENTDRPSSVSVASAPSRTSSFSSTRPLLSTPSPAQPPAVAPSPSPSTSPTTTASSAFTPNVVVDVMRAKPRRLFSTWPTVEDDQKAPRINCVISLPDDTLVMSDLQNRKVKVMPLARPPHTVTGFLSLQRAPLRLALLSDGLVAVTTDRPLILLLKVKSDVVTVFSRIKTARVYLGVAGLPDGLLLVTCRKTLFSRSAMQVLNREGHVVRTVTDGARLSGLLTPRFVFPDGDSRTVLVSDIDRNLVHRIDLNSGDVLHSYGHADIRYPRQVCEDGSGAVYIASSDDDGWVLVRSKDGQWRRLVTSDLSDPGYVFVYGLCLTKNGRLVVAWRASTRTDSVVACYDLV